MVDLAGNQYVWNVSSCSGLLVMEADVCDGSNDPLIQDEKGYVRFQVLRETVIG